MMCARRVLCLIFVLVDILVPKVYFSETMTDSIGPLQRLSLVFAFCFLSDRGTLIMLIANVGTDRLGVNVIPFCLPLLSTLSITYINRENSVDACICSVAVSTIVCCYLAAENRNPRIDSEATKLPPF